MTTQLEKQQGVEDAVTMPEPTFGEVILAAEDGRECIQELVDGGVLPAFAPGILDTSRSASDLFEETGESERPKLMAFADRLLKRLAADEAEITDITAAAKAEVSLITTRYQALAQKATKRASWKRFCLEQIASLLFPDAKAKLKSVNLPYGTLGRRDAGTTFMLVDEAAAIALAERIDRANVKLTIESDLTTFETQIVNLVREIEVAGTINGKVRDFIDRMVNSEAGTSTATLALKWGAVKKQPSVALYTQGSAEHPAGHGVEQVPASTTFYAHLTEG